MAGPEKSDYEKWKDTIDGGLKDDKWNGHDNIIKATVDKFNLHLAGVAGYMPLDWVLIKAMVWVESGAEHSAWKTMPMQIGVAGDPGLRALLHGKEGGDLILPPTIRGEMTENSVRTLPEHNIRAGIGYLLMRMAYFEYQNVYEANSAEYEIKVKAGDNLSKIADEQQSTVAALQELNPRVGMLRPGQTLKCRKASIQQVITKWRSITSQMIQQRYNGNGDPNYAKKLDYVLSALRKGQGES